MILINFLQKELLDLGQPLKSSEPLNDLVDLPILELDDEELESLGAQMILPVMTTTTPNEESIEVDLALNSVSQEQQLNQVLPQNQEKVVSANLLGVAVEDSKQSQVQVQDIHDKLLQSQQISKELRSEIHQATSQVAQKLAMWPGQSDSKTVLAPVQSQSDKVINKELIAAQKNPEVPSLAQTMESQVQPSQGLKLQNKALITKSVDLSSDSGQLSDVADDVTAPVATQNDGMEELSVKQKVSSTAFREELAAKITWLSQKNIKSASLRLNPAQLGPVEVRIHYKENNELNIVFSSGHQVVREALEGSLPRLRELMAQQDCNLTQVDVNQDGAREQQKQQAGMSDYQQEQQHAQGEHQAKQDRAFAPEVTKTKEQVMVVRGLVDTYA